MPGPLLSCRIHYNQYNQYNQCYIDFVDIDARDLSKSVKERLAIPVPMFDSFADPEPHNLPTSGFSRVRFRSWFAEACQNEPLRSHWHCMRLILITYRSVCQ